MRTRKNIKIHVICITLTAISFIFAGTYLMKGKVSNAADTVHVAIEEGVILSKYDVNGDGKPDKVKYTVVDNKDENDSATMRVFINDKIAFEQKKSYVYWSVNLIKLENGKVFFDISSTYDGGVFDSHQLYFFKDNKLKRVYNFQKYFEDYVAGHYYVDVLKVSGNTLNTKVYAQFNTTGSVWYNMNISYVDGAFIRTSNAFTLDYKAMGRKNKWTVARTIKVYKKAGSKKVAYTLKKNNVVKINKVILKNNKVYIQVKKSNGKTGYIPAAKKFPVDNVYFKEAHYAG